MTTSIYLINVLLTPRFKQVEALYLMYVNEAHKEEDGWMGSPYITNLEGQRGGILPAVFLLRLKYFKSQD